MRYRKMLRFSIAALAVLLAGTALAQDPDYGKPGHPGGSWGEPVVPQQEGEYDPGCTPKADVPQSLLDYFAKFKQPIPQKYCATENQSTAEQFPNPYEEPPAQPQVEQPIPIAPPPVVEPDINVQPGQVEIRLPGFELRLRWR